MRTVSLIFILGLIGQATMAQTCLPQGINFSSQALVDNFQTNYPGCIFIEGDVTIGNGYPTDITNLNGLDVLTGIGGGFNMEDQTNLSDFTGFDNLDSINGDVYLFNNSSLTSFTGLGKLTRIGGDFTINNNLNVTGFAGLDSLQRIEGELEIAVEPSVTGFTGLEMVEYLGAFAMNGCHNISDFRGFNGLTTVGGDFLVQDGDLLDSLAGLNNLTSVGGSFFLNYPAVDPHVSSIAALGSLTSVGGLRLSGLNIDNVNGLGSLTSVSGEFNIGGCNNLQSLQGLENLVTLGPLFSLTGNDNLSNIDALENADFSSVVNLNITYNSSLSECAITSLCSFLDGNPSGLVNIHTNASGCSSVAEVEQACMSAGVEDAKNAAFRLYPNPTQDDVIIQLDVSTEIDKLEVFNANGQLVYEMVPVSATDLIRLDLELSAGLYVVRLLTFNSESSVRLLVSEQ